jgi:hypothetical protein
MIGSHNTIELNPTNKIVATLSLSNFYKLEAGKYRVKVSCLIKTMKNESIMLISKPIRLKITK